MMSGLLDGEEGIETYLSQQLSAQLGTHHRVDTSHLYSELPNGREDAKLGKVQGGGRPSRGW
jgi:hypothetical protein